MVSMRLSLQTDYSLRTLMYLATRPERQTVAAVADFFQISQTHIGKVVHHLARRGYIRSIRGIGGGLELARSPDEITIGEIVRAVEGKVHLLECIDMDDVCVIQKHCKLRTVFDRAERIQFDYLDTVRLSDVLPFGLPERSPKQTARQALAIVPSVDDCGTSTNRVKPHDGSALK
jgi:Rrf2 family nitric oxide-sensitive transcriptional repressor